MSEKNDKEIMKIAVLPLNEMVRGSMATEKKVLAWTSLGRTNLWKMRRAGKFPKKYEVGGKKLYYVDDVIDWIESFRQQKIDPSLPTGYRPSKFQKKGGA